MRVVFHPELPADIKRHQADYEEISPRLGGRFRREVEVTIARIKTHPESAGHFLNTGSSIVREFRRANLPSFPFFVLYARHLELIIVGALIPSRSDPLTWLKRLRR